jgi:prepilin-type N-terminal cleavage/methylation domain-containing protein
MNDQNTHGSCVFEAEKNRRNRQRQAGFTLTEMIVVVYVAGLLSAIVTSAFIDQMEKARLARCMSELRGIQSAVFVYSPNGIQIPDPQDFWPMAFPDGRPGPYYYLIDGDPNKGHGNDLDGIDEENPGKSYLNLEKVDIRFVVLCQHDHGNLANYVYVTDVGPPQIVTADNDPGYENFIKWEYGGPGTTK